jgi:hypothetical protein
VTALVGFPSLIAEPGRVLQDIYLHLYLGATEGYDGLDPSGAYVFYLRALAIGLGWPMLLAAVGALAMTVVRRDRASLIVGSFAVALLLVLGSQQLYFARFALPVVPALIVAASLALDALVAFQPALGLAVVGLLVAPTLVDTVRFDALLTRTDTRTLAREWIATTLPAGVSIAVDSVPLGPTLSSQGGHQVLVANDWSLFDLTLAEYRARGVEYVVVSSFTSEARALDPAREARRQAFKLSLRDHSTLVAQFRPYAGEREPPFAYDQIYGPFNALDQLERPGPTVSVYHVG